MLAKAEGGGEPEEKRVVPAKEERRRARAAEEVVEGRGREKRARIVCVSPLFLLQFLCQISGNRLI